jgi:exportin-7
VQIGSVTDAYAHKYKGIALALSMLSRALNGSYVNFGVFELYNDPALNNALDAAMKMALSVPSHDVIVYSKVARSYFVFLEAMCHNHTAFLVSQPHETFVRLVQCLQMGIKSIDVNTSSQCAMAVDQLATWLHRNLIADEVSKVHPAAQVRTDLASWCVCACVREGHVALCKDLLLGTRLAMPAS